MLRIINYVNSIAFVCVLISLILFSYRLIYIFYAFKKDKPLKTTDKKGKFAILIPARDESKVIEHILESIKAQTYDKNFFDVFVITENIEDATNKIVKDYGYNCVIRENLENRRTKGYALDDAIKKIYRDNNGVSPYDAYFIFDADNILQDNFIEEMNKAYQMGIQIGMSYRNASNLHANWVANCSILLFSNMNTFQNKGKNAVTNSTIISGTGYYISSDIIDQFKGFPFDSLTEDYELTNYIALNNISNKYITSTEVYDEQPTSLEVLNKQRVRWCRGFFDVNKKYFKKSIDSFKSDKGNKLAIFECRFASVPNICFIVSFIAYLICLNVLLVASFVLKQREIAFYLIKLECVALISYQVALDIYTLLMLYVERDKIKLSFKEKITCLAFNPFFITLFVNHAVKALFNKGVSWKIVEHKGNCENYNRE